MNSRLQAKIDEIKKNLRDDDDFHPLLCFDARPKQYEVELPTDYQNGMEALLKFIEHRDFLAKELPNFPLKDIAQVRSALSDLTKKIEKLEDLLGKEYEQIVKDQRRDQEIYEATWLQNQISQEHFIMVKQLKPHIFEEFKKWVFNYMTDEEIKEELKIIEQREKTELAAILAADIYEPEYFNPHIRRQSPYDLYNRYTLYLADAAYETDDYFKEVYGTIKTGEKAKQDFISHTFRVLPAARRRLDENIRSLEPRLRKLCLHLRDYSREQVQIGKFQIRADADEKKITEYVSSLKRYQIEIFAYTKHKKPHLLKDLTKVAVKDMTEIEIEEFYQEISKCEGKQLDIIIRAVENEIH